MTRRNFLFKSSILLSSLGLNFGIAADFKSIRIGYLPTTDHLLIIAKNLKTASFTPIKFNSWADLSEAFRAGSIDAAFILTPLALMLKQQGLNIKALFAAHRNGSALVVRRNLVKTDRDFSALRGLRIAIPSRFSTHYLLLAELFKQKGLNLDEVQIIDMPPSEMIFALLNENIDAFIVAEPYNILAQDMNLADVFILSKDIINNHICCVFCVKNELLQLRRKELQVLCNDFFETAQFINKNPNQAAELSEKFIGVKPALIKSLLAQNDRVSYRDLALTPKDIRQTIRFMRENKIGDIEFDYQDFVDNSFTEEED